MPLRIVNFSTLEGVSLGGRVFAVSAACGAWPSGAGGGKTGSVKKSYSLVVFNLELASSFPPRILRTSVSLPVRAAAAAMAGLRR